MPSRAEKPRHGVPLAVLMRRAHGRVRSQVKAGLMIVPDRCAHCGENPGRGRDGRRLLQAHHHLGYDRPLDVEWLCVGCHRAETPVNPLRGEAGTSAKLTEQDVRAIRAAGREAGTTILARRYGVSSKAIRLVLTRETWAHVD